MTYQHFDRIGKPLALGDIVAYPDSNQLQIGQILKFNPKKHIVTGVEKGNKTSRRLKYSSDLIKIEGSELTIFLLRQ